FEYRDFRGRPPAEHPPASDPAVIARWSTRLTNGGVLSELEGLALLQDFGIPVVAHRAARSQDEALAAADLIGWPVALETAATGVTHKSDVGGVQLGLTGPDALRDAYRELAARLGPEV